MPTPSGNTVRKEINKGDVSPGVDTEILDEMVKISEGKPYLRHGVIIWDEVRFLYDFLIT